MYKTRTLPSYPLYDYQTREKLIRDQIRTRNSRKTTLVTTPPPPVPRLEMYKKRMARERAARLKAETRVIKQIKAQEERRGRQRKAFKSPNQPTETLDDQLQEISLELGIPMIVFEHSNYQEDVFYQYEKQIRLQQLAAKRRSRSMCNTHKRRMPENESHYRSSYLAEGTRYENDGMMVYDEGIPSSIK